MKIVHRDTGPITTALDMLEGGLTQPVPLPTLDSVLNRVDEAINEAVRDNNPDAAFRIGLQLVQVSRMVGFALAKFLWRMKQRAAEFHITEDAFEDIVFDKMGLPPDTTKNYARAWDRIESLPIDSKTRNLLLEKGIKAMIAIVKAESHLVKIGKTKFSETQLEKLAKTADHSTLVKTLNKLKGQKDVLPKQYFKLKRDGTLEFWASGKRLIIGILYISNPGVKVVVDHILEVLGVIIE